ncbi:MAG: SDR family oxidoreductase [Phycisphaerales bacterium]|nr:SDR family oxidoreductase [Phycisphaerales bacterium]
MDQTTTKAALVTGAGSGIGQAIALALGQAGYRVLLVGRTQKNLEATRDLLPPGAGVVHAADVSDERACRAMVDAAFTRLGRLDVLVNNAGVGRVVPIAQTDSDVVAEAYRINTFPAAWAIHAAWDRLAAQGGGCVINISSMATIDPFPGFFAYAGSKAALNLMAASAATEGKPHGIRAFAIAPGAVETPMLRAAFDTKAIPPEEALPPKAVAEVVLACVRGERDADNGRTIPVLAPGAKAWLAGWYREHPPLLD